MASNTSTLRQVPTNIRVAPPHQVSTVPVFNHAGSVYRNVHPVIGKTFNFTGNTTVRNQAYDYERTHATVRVQDFRGNRNSDQWRYGYYQRPDFDDTNFYFSLYLFSPFEAPCVVSPWYYYQNLPAYLPASEVVISNDSCNWNAGIAYSYNPDAQYDSYGNANLNQAVDEITSIFQNQDQGAIQSVIANDSQIAVYNDGSYMYTLNGQDFQKMMADNSENTQTTAFQVTSVRVQNGYAIVNAQHSFTDEVNGSETVYQQYRLRNQDGRYVITDFMTSQTPFASQPVF